MDTLTYIREKFGVIREIDLLEEYKMPIQVRNVSRIALSKVFFELNFTRGAEIGVEQGEYSETLLENNPSLNLYSIDAWQAHSGYRDHTNQSKLDNFYQITQDRLSQFGNRSIIMKGYSMEVLEFIDDESLDFVYIDADHSFVTVTNDIYEWSKKVRKGGIIAGHDYITGMDHIHVPYVLEGYMKAYKIRPYFVLNSDIEGEIPSWFFIK